MGERLLDQLRPFEVAAETEIASAYDADRRLREDLGVAEYTVGHGFRATEEWLEMLGTTALWAPMLLLLGDSVDLRIGRRAGAAD